MKKLILSLSTLAIVAMSFGCTNPTASNPTAGSGDIFSGNTTFTKQQFANYLDCVANAIPPTDTDSAALKNLITSMKPAIMLIPDAQWDGKIYATQFQAFKTVMANLNCKI